MKWILAILLLISSTSFGQIGRGDDSTKYIRYPTQYGMRLARSWWDSVAHMPYGDTAIFPKPSRPGAIMMHTDKNFYKWNGGGWAGMGSGTTSSDTFGLQDNEGVRDRYMNMQGHDFAIDSAGQMDLKGQAGGINGQLTLGNIAHLFSYDNGVHVHGISVYPTYIGINGDASNSPPKIWVQASDSLKELSPSSVAVFKNDTLKTIPVADLGALMGAGENFANTDLTFTADRFHDNNGHSLSIHGTGDNAFKTVNGTKQYTVASSSAAASLSASNSANSHFSEINAIDSSAILIGGKNGDFYNSLEVSKNNIRLTTKANTTPHIFKLDSTGQMSNDAYGASFETSDSSMPALVVDGSGNVFKRRGDNGGGSSDLAFTSMVNLRSYNATSTVNNTQAVLYGFYTPGDGGGGLFVWNNTSTTADDSGTVIKSTPVTTGRWLRVYNNDINAYWFGGIPNGSRVVTSALQNALNKTGHIIVPYSNRRFIIDDRLLIKSNTFLEINPSDTIYLADSTNTVMIRNYTTDTTGITDHDITIKGGIWDNNWNGNPGTNAVNSVYKMLQSDKTSPVRGIAGTLDFCGIRNLNVLNLTVRNGLLFPIHITHAENTEVGNIYFDRDVASISDGVHMSTPQYNFYIHDIAGKNGDDVVALGSWEWLIANPGGQVGDIKKGTIERIRIDTCAWSLVKMYTGNTSGVGGIYDIVIKDIKGISKNQAFYWGTTPDQANPSHTTTSGMISNVTMEDVHAGTLNAQSALGVSWGSIVLLDCNFKNVTLKNITMDTGYVPASGEPWLRSTANASVKNLSIENFNQVSIPSYGWLFDLDGAGDGFSLSGSTFKGTGSFTGNLAYPRVRVINSGAWGNINISSNKFDGVAGALWQSATGGGAIVNVSNNVFRNYNEAVVSGSQMNLSITGNQFYSGATAVFSSYGTSRVNTAGNVADYVGAGVGLVRPAGTVKWVGTDLPVDAALITPAAYDMINNTNAGAGDLGVTQYTGSSFTSVTAASSSPGGSNGNIQYKSGSAFSGTNNLHWDNTNTRLGVRTASPISALDVDGNDVSNLTARFGSFGIQSFSSANGFMINNGYYDNSGGVFKYLANGASAWLQFASGNIYFSAAPSGTAGGSMSAVNNMLINNTGTINMTSLAGSGIRMVTANASGDLGSQAIPSTGDLTGAAVKANIHVVNDADYTVASTDYAIIYSAMSADRTLTLPSASTNTNRMLVLRHGGGAHSLNLSVAIREDSSITVSILGNDESVTIISDGTDWWIVAHGT